MKRTRHLIWIFPLVIVAAVALLYQAGASRLSVLALKKELARQYGVSEGTIEELAELLPAGWQFGDPIELEADPHQHVAPAGVQVIEDEDTGVTLTFAHLGDGHFAGQDEPLQTTYFVVNNTRQLTNGTIEFFEDDGSPLELEIDGVTESSFPFQLNRGNMQRFVTSGAGELKSGWARIRSQQPVVVNSTFGAIREDGTVISDVGVGESELGTEFTIFADTIGNNDTGVALTNPHDDDPVDIEMTLRDAAGAQVAQDMLHLEPRGHTALFVHQLFPAVPGIREFEGTVVFKSMTAPAEAGPTLSGQPAGEALPVTFAGLTLRISGPVFTSVPMVPPPPPDADFTKLAFPQAADGELAGLSVSTTPVLFNNTDQPASGVIEFFKSDGTANLVRINGEATSSILFDIPPRGVFRIDTDGVGEIAVGWARVTMDQPLAGLVIFTIKDATGSIVAAVGVDSAPLRQAFQLVVDKTQLFNTALAIVNPLDPVGVAGEIPATIRLNLKNTLGNFVGPEKTIELLSREHRALFVTEIFPEVDFAEFEGRLEVVTCGDCGQFAAALSLRSAVEKLTSLPVFAEKHAFQPSVTVEPATNLRSSSPSLKWQLHQFRGDLMLKQVEAVVEGLRFHTESLIVGSDLAAGYQDRPESLVQLLTREVDEGFVEYDLVFTTDEFEVRGQGQIQNLPEGVQFTLTDLDAHPATDVSLDTDIAFHFASGLFEIQQEAEELVIEVMSTSVSQSTVADLPLRRRSRQTVVLAEPDPVLANVARIGTPLLTATNLITIGGTNLGDAPRVLFPGQQGVAIAVAPFETEDDELSVFVPAGTVAGEVRVDNGGGPGNGYLTDVLFSPLFSMGQEAGTDRLRLELSQKGDILSMEEIYEIRVYTVTVDFEQLAIGQQVGTFGEGFGERGLFVQSKGADTATLEIASAAATNVIGTLILEQVEPDTISIRTPPENEASDAPDLLLRNLSFLIHFDGLPLTFPDAGEIVFAEALVTSGPTEPEGAAPLVVKQSDAFLR